jgi:hypothetical protein
MGEAAAILHYMLWRSRTFCKKNTIETIANKINGFGTPLKEKWSTFCPQRRIFCRNYLARKK